MADATSSFFVPLQTEELERSVAFYTKANSTLASCNRDLERQLLIAKQRLVEMGLSAPSIGSKCGAGSSKVAAFADVNSKSAPPGEAAVKSLVEPSGASTVASKCPIQDEVTKLAASAVPPCPGVDLTQNATSTSAAGNDEDEYLKALKQFAAHQSAIATAAAASANAAYQAIKYHEMMKKNGQTSTARFPLEQFLKMKPLS